MENNLALAVPNPGARPSAPDYRASIIAAAVAAVAGHWGNGDYEIKLEKKENIDGVMDLVRQGYEYNK